MIKDSKVLFLTIFIFISILSLLFVQFKAYDTYAHSIKESNKMKQTAKDIRYLDEVLTMSARMAAYTGDPNWITRYDMHVTILDEKLAYISKDNEVRNLISQTKNANDMLVQLELESFRLVKAQKPLKAQQILSNTIYQLNKDYYTKGLNNTIKFINTKSENILKTQKNNFLLIIYISILLIILMVLFNFYIIKLLQKYTSKLEHQKELYNLVSDNSPYGILFIDTNTNKFIKCNDNAVRYLGYPNKEAFIDKYPHEISPKYQENGKLSKDEIEKYIKLALDDKGTSFEWQHLKADGNISWIEITLCPININNQDMIHVVWKDINDRKKAENELKLLHAQLEQKVVEKTQENIEKDKLITEQSKLVSMGEMIGNIAHQWRQPLSVISSASTGVLIYKDLGKLNDEFLEKEMSHINDNAQYLSKTIDDFKDFIKGDVKKVPFKISESVTSLLNLVDGTKKANSIEVILDIEEDLEMLGHPNQLTQCFINIFNNAKDALKEKDEPRYIFITVRKKDENVEITFKDNAGGFPEDTLPRIFEPYFTTKHQSKGTGLGLSMTYNIIVDSMQGEIKASNTTYDYENNTYKGATLIITLPLT